MSTVDRTQPRTLPLLVDGQRLDRPTFHERYAAMPGRTRAELVGGVVSMPSPLRSGHGDMDHYLGFWVVRYRQFTPGLASSANATTQLGDDSETQPDSQLRIPEELGGLTRIVDGYITGPPELIIEVGHSSRAYDLGPKKDDYEKAGVPEYLFVGVDPDEVRWFVRREGGSRRWPRARMGPTARRSSPGSGSTRRPSSPRISTGWSRRWSGAWSRPSMRTSSPAWPPERRGLERIGTISANRVFESPGIAMIPPEGDVRPHVFDGHGDGRKVGSFRNFTKSRRPTSAGVAGEPSEDFEPSVEGGVVDGVGDPEVGVALR